MAFTPPCQANQPGIDFRHALFVLRESIQRLIHHGHVPIDVPESRVPRRVVRPTAVAFRLRGGKLRSRARLPRSSRLSTWPAHGVGFKGIHATIRVGPAQKSDAAVDWFTKYELVGKARVVGVGDGSIGDESCRRTLEELTPRPHTLIPRPPHISFRHRRRHPARRPMRNSQPEDMRVLNAERVISKPYVPLPDGWHRAAVNLPTAAQKRLLSLRSNPKSWITWALGLSRTMPRPSGFPPRTERHLDDVRFGPAHGFQHNRPWGP